MRLVDPANRPPLVRVGPDGRRRLFGLGQLVKAEGVVDGAGGAEDLVLNGGVRLAHRLNVRAQLLGAGGRRLAGRASSRACPGAVKIVVRRAHRHGEWWWTATHPTLLHRTGSSVRLIPHQCGASSAASRSGAICHTSTVPTRRGGARGRPRQMLQHLAHAVVRFARLLHPHLHRFGAVGVAAARQPRVHRRQQRSRSPARDARAVGDHPSSCVRYWPMSSMPMLSASATIGTQPSASLKTRLASSAPSVACHCSRRSSSPSRARRPSRFRAASTATGAAPRRARRPRGANRASGSAGGPRCQTRRRGSAARARLAAR